MNTNPQLTIIRSVLASLGREDTQEKLRKFIFDIIDHQGDTTEEIILDNVRYTVVFVDRENRVLCTLRAIPTDMEGGLGFPIEARMAVINREEERVGVEVEEIPAETINERIQFMFKKMIDNATFLVGNEGLIRYAISDFITNPETGEYDKKKFHYRSTETNYYFENASFKRSFYLLVEEDYRSIYGNGFIMTFSGCISDGLFTDFHVEVRCRNGSIRLTLPFIYVTPEESQRAQKDQRYRAELIDSYISPSFVQNVINCFTLVSFSKIRDSYRMYWSALREDFGPDVPLRSTNINTEYIEILKPDETPVFAFLPFYNTHLLESEFRADHGIRLNLSAIDEEQVKNPMTHTRKLSSTHPTSNHGD